jgi:hypothetical protein
MTTAERTTALTELTTALTELADELDQGENMDPYWVKYQGPLVREAITALLAK